MKEETSKNTAMEQQKKCMPYVEPTEEELEQELQDILKKRKAYQEELELEVLAIQKAEAAKKKKSMSGMVKAAVIVLVAGVSVFAFSMKSEATRMWWLESVERIIGSDTSHVVNNDENRMTSDTPEQQAIAEIESKAKVPMPKLKYRPAEFIFDSYNYDEIIGSGSLYYLYGDYVIVLNAHTSDKDSAYAWNYDGEVVSEQIVETEYASVKIVEIIAENDTESTFAAEWVYHNHQYQIAGKIGVEDLKAVTENIFY